MFKLGEKRWKGQAPNRGKWKVKQTGGARNLLCDHTSLPSGSWFPPNTNRYLLSTLCVRALGISQMFLITLSKVG